MKRIKAAVYPYPREVCEMLSGLGERVRVARIRRKIRQEDLASRTGLSRSTIQAIERGEPTVAIGNVFQVLWTLGLGHEVSLLADPGLDQDGLALSVSSGPKRVYVKKKVDNDF